jgi:hypothetical protein
MENIEELLNTCEKLGKEYETKHQEIESMYTKYKDMAQNTKINKDKSKRISELIESTKKQLMSKEEFELLKKEQKEIMNEFNSLEKIKNSFKSSSSESNNKNKSSVSSESVNKNNKLSNNGIVNNVKSKSNNKSNNIKSNNNNNKSNNIKVESTNNKSNNSGLGENIKSNNISKEESTSNNQKLQAINNSSNNNSSNNKKNINAQIDSIISKKDNNYKLKKKLASVFTKETSCDKSIDFKPIIKVSPVQIVKVNGTSPSKHTKTKNPNISYCSNFSPIY